LRVAVISDVHGNLPALEAVLEHVGQEGIDELWSLGDIVGYGGKPHECLALVRERAAICLGGNHDLVVSGVLDIGQFTSDAGVAARWTRSVLTQEELELLAALSPQGERAGISLFHGSIRDPVWEYVLTADVADASLRAQTTDLSLVGRGDPPDPGWSTEARGMLVESDHPVAGKVKVVGVPVKLSETPGSVRDSAPLLGQHTDVILAEAGLSTAEIARLRDAGVVR